MNLPNSEEIFNIPEFQRISFQRCSVNSSHSSAIHDIRFGNHVFNLWLTRQNISRKSLVFLSAFILDPSRGYSSKICPAIPSIIGRIGVNSYLSCGYLRVSECKRSQLQLRLGITDFSFQADIHYTNPQFYEHTFHKHLRERKRSRIAR